MFRFGPLLRLAATLAVFALIWRMVDAPAALARLAGAEAGWLLAALAALTGQTVLSALRWRLTAARLGQRFGAGPAVREYYLAQLVNQTLPGGVLGDAGRAVRARHGAGLAVAGQAVVLERLAGQVALFAVLLAGMGAAAVLPGAPVWPAWAVSVALWLAGGLAVAAALATVFGGRARGPAAALLRAAGVALLARGVRGRQAALSLGTVAINLAAFGFCARATGSAMPPLMVLTVVPLVLTAMLIPLSVSGWGLREGAAAALWPVFGAAPEAGVAASVAFGLAVLVASLPGLFVLAAAAPAAPYRPTSGD